MPSKETLLKDLLTIHTEANTLHGNLARLDAELGKLDDALQEPKTVAADIGQVDHRVNDVNEMLTVVEITPPITEEVNMLKTEPGNVERLRLGWLDPLLSFMTCWKVWKIS